MSVYAADVAAALRERLPDLPIKKLHKLLYYCQGHHLAHTGSPLFGEQISAFDMGPVVGRLWYAEKEEGPQPPRTALDEGQLNTVGYVVSRYGALSGRDLEILTHHQDPWMRADRDRPEKGSVRIEREWIFTYFRSEEAEEDFEIPSDLLRRWSDQVADDDPTPVEPDTVEELQARIHRRTLDSP